MVHILVQDMIVQDENIIYKNEPNPDKIEPRSCCNKANTLQNLSISLDDNKQSWYVEGKLFNVKPMFTVENVTLFLTNKNASFNELEKSTKLQFSFSQNKT